MLPNAMDKKHAVCAARADIALFLRRNTDPIEIEKVGNTMGGQE
jgi:hypothetical protein